MPHPILFLTFTAAHINAKGCGPGSHPDDCAGLLALASATKSERWVKNTKWGKADESVCKWYGVTCDASSGRVVNISLKENGLTGHIPDEISKISYLQSFRIQGGRPANYNGCTSTNLQNSSLPTSFFDLTHLVDVDLEYSCLGGTLKGWGNLTNLISLQLHGNFITGTIPSELGLLTEVKVLKLGRNPISGRLPLFTTLSKVIQFNCNFCALTGQFPDMFLYFPSLEISYWDGNGFSGSLPLSLASAKKLRRVSFNINSFTGSIPPGLCSIPAGDGGDTVDTTHDCRIGSDTDLKVYQADQYPWIIKVPGNIYNCSEIPTCAKIGSCNKTKGVNVINPISLVRCR